MSGEFYDQQQIGQQIADGRIEAGLTQADLASRVSLDRTAIAKIESGARKVSAVELARIATTLDRPIDWFPSTSPQAVVSRRIDAVTGRRSVSLDRTVEQIARDIDFLLGEGLLSPTAISMERRPPRDLDEAM